METLNYMESVLKDVEEQLLNKKDFTNEVAKRCMVTPYVVDEIFNISSGVAVEELLKGNQVEIPKMGKFTLKERKSTTYKGLFGKEDCTIEKYVYPHFQIANFIKTKVKNGVKNPKTI